ncbi:polyketide cyclase/dehydrase [Myxozyma melibiosi]|uniref:Polyketide cyclase/dehydrase n=1 Tax=Myxozyma melibiosi TaxID=54550 RepID=A0ABR1F3U4_9ASCO
MKRIETEIIINAPPSKVHDVLLDFAKYAEWNALLPSIKVYKGDAAAPVGSTLEVRLALPGKSPMTIYPIVRVNDERKLAWEGAVVHSILFSGVHAFECEPIEGGAKTKLLQYEDFSGWLLPVLGSMISSAEGGYNSMNEALKKRVEGSV